MQSIIQYRRYEKAVRAQYERDKAKFDPSVLETRPSHQSLHDLGGLPTDLISPVQTNVDASPQIGIRNSQVDPEKLDRSDRQESSGSAQTADVNQDPSADVEKLDYGERQQSFAPVREIATSEPATEQAEVPQPDSSSDSGSDSISSSASSSSSAEGDGGVQLSNGPMTRLSTQQSQSVQMGRVMTGVNVRKRTTREGGEEGGMVFVVGFEGPKDPLNPHNWSYLTRWRVLLNVAMIGWTVGFASSVDSGALKQASEDFGVSDVVESLATGIFLIGFGCGALTAGPLSEELGRNPVYIGTLVLYMIFIMASALAPNIGAQIAFRFLAGWFGATPLACAGGSISDVFDADERVFTFPVFANSAFMGPIIGPIVGGFVGQSSNLSWRWCEWITLIISGGVLAFIVLIQPETYPPTLLRWRAAHLRKITGDNRFRAPAEVRLESFGHRLKRALYRPFVLLLREPIVMLFGLYLTIIYIILFTFLNGFTFIFGDTYGFTEGITGLCFISIAIGLCFATPLVIPIYKRYKRELRAAREDGKESLPPETRLWFAMYGAPAVPISLFWMGWTAYPSVSYWSPLVAAVVFGYGILCIFISCYQYLIDAYALYAASALASVTVVRYIASGGMVEVAIPMYGNLGVHWTLTILGCLSAITTPLPYLFFFYGHKVRAWSKYART